jgi:hypothetical protein
MEMKLSGASCGGIIPTGPERLKRTQSIESVVDMHNADSPTRTTRPKCPSITRRGSEAPLLSYPIDRPTRYTDRNSGSGCGSFSSHASRPL